MFISKKKLKELETRLLARDEDCATMKKKIKVLECTHDSTRMYRYDYGYIMERHPTFDGPVGFEECKDCGKRIKNLETEKDFYTAELQKAQAEIDKIKARHK